MVSVLIGGVERLEGLEMGGGFSLEGKGEGADGETYEGEAWGEGVVAEEWGGSVELVGVWGGL